MPFFSKMKKIKTLYGFLGLLVIASLLSNACKNDIQQIDQFVRLDTLPGEFVEGLVMKISENGKITAKLTAPVMILEDLDSIHKTIFPQGFEMYFFDENEKVNTVLKAGYGIDHQDSSVFVAKKDVVFESMEEDKHLYTEHLIWNKKQGKIFSFVPFKYIKGKDIIYGDTLIADEDMKYYTIKKSSAVISVQKEKL